MRINHNIAALNTYRQLSQNQNNVSKSLERLSSGMRINRASDDAAGLAVSEKMRTQIRGLAMAERNSMDGVSLIQTAEGALDTVHSILQRMRELAVQAANGTNTTSDSQSIQDEINALSTEINRVGNTLEFNTKRLLNGAATINTITNTGKLTGGTNGIAGAEAAGTLTAGGSTLSVKSVDKSSELNGYTIVIDPDNTAAAAKQASVSVSNINGSGNTLTITSNKYGKALEGYEISFVDGGAGFTPTDAVISGNKITVTADFNGGALTLQADIETAISTKLTAAGLTGEGVKLSGAPALNLADLANKGPFQLAGGAEKVTATVTGRTVRLAGNWSNGTAAAQPTNADIEKAINDALKGAGFGQITMTPNTATALDPNFYAGGSITLSGGITSASAKSASRSIIISATPHQDDVLTLKDPTGVTKKIGFWDSSDTKYATPLAAQTALGVDSLIDIYNGSAYKETSDITLDIAAFASTLFTDYTFKASEAGSDLLISAKTPGVAGNDFTTTFEPSKQSGLSMQIGANTGQQLLIDIPTVRSQVLNITGITSGATITSRSGKYTAKLTAEKVVGDGQSSNNTEYALDVTDPKSAAGAIEIFDEAVSYVSQVRAKLGAYQNRLEYTVSNLSVSEENLTAAESRIRDSDMALEMTNFTKNNIINQAATAMLAQANQLPQGVLQLLQ